MRISDGVATEDELGFASFLNDMRRIGTLADSTNQICIYAKWIGLRFEDVQNMNIREGFKKFWLSFEHSEAYLSMFPEDSEVEKDESLEQVAPDMTPEQFLEMLGMEVIESGEGYATGRR